MSISKTALFSAPLTSEQWGELREQLEAPFAIAELDFMPAGKVEPGKPALFVAFVDARAVQQRLDDVCGLGNWSYTWQALSFDKDGQIATVLASLTIFGVTKQDVGVASDIEKSMGCVSHGLKRVGVEWTIGRYLYRLPDMWLQPSGRYLSDAERARLRSRVASWCKQQQLVVADVDQHVQPADDHATTIAQDEAAASAAASTIKPAAKRVDESSAMSQLGASPAQRTKLRTLAKQLGITSESALEAEIAAALNHANEITPFEKLTVAQASRAIDALNMLVDRREGAQSVTSDLASEAQKRAIFALCKKAARDVPADLKMISKKAASTLIGELNAAVAAHA